MQSFLDNRGKRWTLAVDFTTARHVRRLLGVDLVGMAPPDLFRKLESPLFLVDVLYGLCWEEATTEGIDDVAFGKRCVIDLQPVLDSLLEEIADFFQALGKTQRATTLKMTWAMTKANRALTESHLGTVFAAMEKSIKFAAVGSESGEPSTETRQSPELAIYQEPD